MKRAYVETYGCQMNKLDSELAEQALAEAGFLPADDPAQADLVVLNTCSVREHAEHRVVSRLGRLKPGSPLRKPGSVLALVGCMGQREGERLFQVAPHLDIVTGTKEFVRLPELYDQARAGRSRLAALDLSEDFEYARDPRHRSDRHKAFVSIMRGCDLHCTYCIVPTTRGAEESRPLAQVVDEVRRLVDDGVVEVTLLGQTVNSWGKQLPGAPDLADLLAALDELPGLLRTRFITSHPNFFRDRFWERVRDLRTFCPFVHVPAQSGSDRVLKRMARLYTTDQYRDMVAEARAAIPDVALASDWIVGFPGETDDDHAQSRAFLREVGFVQSFVFKYSPRPETPSERRFDDDVPEAVKDARCNDLLAIQDELALAQSAREVGRTLEVLVDGPSKTNEARLSGRTRRNKIVVFEGPAHLAGRLVPITIERASTQTLYGRVADGAAEDAAPSPPAAPRRLPLVQG
ncbi:MAG: tRNA (N6-isopentenyl adenosine(37)-C2)-methylthiotransferase MiaB [Planctomycetes bacterium]|nr:tRNA (N6-isopentenyl adenosine(37)-C2)-methylthiotransferase MiaB [Planctomycetota bacterium]